MLNSLELVQISGLCILCAYRVNLHPYIIDLDEFDSWLGSLDFGWEQGKSTVLLSLSSNHCLKCLTTQSQVEWKGLLCIYDRFIRKPIFLEFLMRAFSISEHQWTHDHRKAYTSVLLKRTFSILYSLKQEVVSPPFHLSLAVTETIIFNFVLRTVLKGSEAFLLTRSQYSSLPFSTKDRPPRKDAQ